MVEGYGEKEYNALSELMDCLKSMGMVFCRADYIVDYIVDFNST